MFDPSKLDLNIDDLQDKPKEKLDQNETTSKPQTEEVRGKEEKPQEIQNITPPAEPIIGTEPQEIKEKIHEDPLAQTSIPKQNLVLKNEEAEKEEANKDGEQEEEEKKDGGQEKEEEKKIIFNINITSLQDIINILIEKEYDFLVLEPGIDGVKISFRKEKVEKEYLFVKYPIYSKIIIKAKTLTNLAVDETNETQEGTGEVSLHTKTYKIITKVVPSEGGEKLFLKAKLLEKKVKKEVKKTSVKQILGFLGAIAFISLVLGGAFIGFIVLNAKTVEDVKFFYSLGINLNDINNFITELITIIFSILLFIETVFLVIFLFKFSLTKKGLKQRKIRYAILGSFFLILTLSTASIWMIIDRQVKSLPNWQEMAYGDVQLYDNSKLTSDQFDKGGSLIEDTSNIIGPVEIKFDLSFFAKKEEQKGTRINKFIWDFGGKENVETQSPTIIKRFDTKGNHPVALTIETVDLKGQVTEKKVDNIPNIDVSYIVKKTEKKLNNGGKLVNFDATALKELGKIEWYFLEDIKKPVWKGYTFQVGKPIFEETLVGMYIKRNDKTSTTLDKIFVIGGEELSSIDGKIESTRGVINDLEFEFEVQDIKNDFGEGFIEEYKWFVDGKEFTKVGSIQNPSESSRLKYVFNKYGDYAIRVVLKNSSGKTKELQLNLNIPQKIQLKNILKIYNNNNLLEDVEYQSRLHEYYINNLGTPTTLTFDARFVRADNLLYTLTNVDWDFDNNGDKDDSKKSVVYDVNTPGNHTIEVEYTFTHRKIEDDIIKVQEKIFIEGAQKDALLDLQVVKRSNYAPAIVQFDASKSIIKNEDIAKFVWDYGDGTSYEGDAVIPGHRYSRPGNYKIKLTIVTESGKEYEISKTFVLKPKPQNARIDVSLKKTFVGGGIDFSSSKSEGQIVSYLWDFGDGRVSTEANPTHSYQKEGTYKVTLKVDFANKNIGEDTVEIIIEDE